MTAIVICVQRASCGNHCVGIVGSRPACVVSCRFHETVHLYLGFVLSARHEPCQCCSGWHGFHLLFPTQSYAGNSVKGSGFVGSFKLTKSMLTGSPACRQLADSQCAAQHLYRFAAAPSSVFRLLDQDGRSICQYRRLCAGSTDTTTW